MYDVIIVGAGTAGLHLARKLSDLNVLVLEKKQTIGEKTCSGLYSSDLEKFEKIPKEAKEHRIEGLVLHSPSGKEIDLKIKQRPWVVDRKKFNKLLAEGVNIKTGEEVKDLDFGKKVKVKTKTNVFESKILVGADGGNSFVRNFFGEKPKELVTGLIVYVNKQDCGNNVDVWVDKNLTKDGFLWKIPRGERIEYGMLGTDISFKKLERFFKLNMYEREASFIPAGFHKTVFDRTLLLGDAACQTKPWSLGGVLYGFVAGDIAADVIKKNLDEENSLKMYETLWKKKLGKSIKRGLLFRDVFKKIDNKKVDLLFGGIRALKIKNFDMDHPFLNVLGR